MALPHFPFITLIIFLAIPLSNGDNYKHTACSIPYSCGKIQNVGYPFWGDNRPKFCGMPEFKLNCLDGRNTVMYVFGYKYIGLRVVDINSSSHTIVFSLDELFKRCYYLNESGISYLSVLKPDDIYKNISIFYGCDHKVSMFCSKSSFNCSNYENGLVTNSGTAFYFHNQSDISKIVKSRLCRNHMSFLVDKRGLDELRSNVSSLSNILTKWPIIKAKYLANFSVCSECEKSGGRCGSLESPEQFVCYCRHGIYSRVCPSSGRKHLILIFGSGIAGGTLVLVAIIGAFMHSNKQRSCSPTRQISLDASDDLRKENIYFGVPLFSYRELVEATDNFDQSNVLGNGGFGIVYYGKLKDGREVAVKHLYEKTFKRVEQFMNEVELLTCLRHQNLVSLYGCTSHQSRELLLVYEFVKNGTVADHLYGDKAKLGSLPWPARLKIAIETAAALSYLHASDIIHRDVKTSNILLDSNFGVKVVDFGLSRLFPTDVTHVSTAPQGTPGYLDPEYFQCYQLTDKSDVYSFGVVLVELISSLPAVDLDRCRQEINLANYAINKIQRCAFEELVDPQLGFTLDSKVRRMIISVAELAFQCLQHDREFRPSMDDVLECLKSIEGVDCEDFHVELVIDQDANRQKRWLKENREEVKLHICAPSPSPVSGDHARLLSDNRLCSYSPIYVMDKWVSRSTTPCTSK